jgi:hypothetical protein
MVVLVVLYRYGGAAHARGNGNGNGKHAVTLGSLHPENLLLGFLVGR